MAASDWLFYDNAIEEFSSKFRDSDVAVSLFRHCLEKGFIRARCENVTRNGKVISKGGSFKNCIDDEGMIAPEAWDYVDFDTPGNKDSGGSFSLVDQFTPRVSARVHGVRCHRADIAKLVSRKGAGGAPFKTVHWMRMTSVLLDLALTGAIEQFDEFPDFLSFLDEAVNESGDALDRSSLRPQAKSLWAQIENHRARHTSQRSTD